MIIELKKARQLIATCGWVGPASEPFCRTSNGGACLEDYEGVATFSVQGALLVSDAWPGGWYAMETVVAPSTGALNRFDVDPRGATVEQLHAFQRLCRGAVDEMHLQAWLQAAERTTEDVLRVFVRAIERSKREAA